VGTTGTAQQSPDIKSIIQEIVNRPAWNPAGNLTIIITGTGKRVAESYEGLPAKAPLLYVEYSLTKDLPAAVAEAAINQKIEPSEVRITLFPNPATYDFNVRLESAGSIESISVYNTMGILINKFYPIPETVETKINCSTYPPGLYFIKIETENGSMIAKFIKK
jgi:hypothetical protein